MNALRWLLSLGFGLVFASSAAAQTAKPEAAQLEPARVEAFMSGAVRQAMRDDRVVGATVAVVDRNGIVMARGYGRASGENAADADTLFRIGSISKTFTWIALLQLAEAGRLSLDDPVNTHLPPALQVADDGFAEPVLVRHLMTHTAGFEDSALGHLFVDAPERVTPLQQYLARYRVKRVRAPGELAVYSNYGAALAGAIVEHESGQDWASYAETRILRPLGMNTSTFREIYSPEIASANALPAPAAESVAQRISQGFHLEAGAMQATPFEFITQIAPAGGMSASANDMTLYMRALLDPKFMASAGVLREDTARTLATPIFANDERLAAWRHGFMSFDLGGGRWAFGHGGDTLYQHSELVMSPELGFGLFVSINTSAQTRAPASSVEAFVDEFFPAPSTTRADVKAEESARFAGAYLGLRRPFTFTERALFRIIGESTVSAAENGDLVVAAGGEMRRFLPLGDGLYQSVDGPRRIAFRESNGIMRLYDPYGLAPAERHGFLQSANWFAMMLLLGASVAFWGVIAGVRRAFARKEGWTALAFDGLCLIWLAALAALGLALAPWLGPDQAVIVFNYPGALFPIACWLLAAAATATLLTPLGAVALARPKDWNWLRWTRAGACVAVFAALALTLWDFGLLGYSGY